MNAFYKFSRMEKPKRIESVFCLFSMDRSLIDKDNLKPN